MDDRTLANRVEVCAAATVLVYLLVSGGTVTGLHDRARERDTTEMLLGAVTGVWLVHAWLRRR